jgi:hypothetical protein
MRSYIHWHGICARLLMGMDGSAAVCKVMLDQLKLQWVAGFRVWF